MVETVERTIRTDHPQAVCIETVLANPHAIWEVLIGLSQAVGTKKITPNGDVFWDLVSSTEYLTEALGRAADRAR